jgi:hypothetical protein
MNAYKPKGMKTISFQPGTEKGRAEPLIDEGDLETGVFQRRGSNEHYIIRSHVL